MSEPGEPKQMDISYHPSTPEFHGLDLDTTDAEDEVLPTLSDGHLTTKGLSHTPTT